METTFYKTFHTIFTRGANNCGGNHIQLTVAASVPKREIVLK